GSFFIVAPRSPGSAPHCPSPPRAPPPPGTHVRPTPVPASAGRCPAVTHHALPGTLGNCHTLLGRRPSARGRGAWRGSHGLRHRRALHRHEGRLLRRRLPRRVHLRGRRPVLHPPRGVHRLRGLRPGLPGRRDLPRDRRARRVGDV